VLICVFYINVFMILIEATIAPVPPRLYMLNVNSLVKRYAVTRLAGDISHHDADVAVITETHMNRRHADDDFAIVGYDLLRRDRVGRTGGGVAVYAARQVQQQQQGLFAMRKIYMCIVYKCKDRRAARKE